VRSCSPDHAPCHRMRAAGSGPGPFRGRPPARVPGRSVAGRSGAGLLGRRALAVFRGPTACGAAWSSPDQLSLVPRGDLRARRRPAPGPGVARRGPAWPGARRGPRRARTWPSTRASFISCTQAPRLPGGSPPLVDALHDPQRDDVAIRARQPPEADRVAPCRPMQLADTLDAAPPASGARVVACVHVMQEQCCAVA